MPFTIERNDLALMQTDVIVVPANEGLQINGGAGLAVAEAAGLAQMQAACDALGGCPTGSAVVTPGFALSAKHVVHVVGPVWQGGAFGEEEQLRSAYDSALNCADEVGAQSVALPLVSAHTFGVPVRLSFSIAVEAVKDFLRDHDTEVHLVLYGSDALAVGKTFFGDVAEYIDDHYVSEFHHVSNMPAPDYRRERPLQGPSAPLERSRKRKPGILAGLARAADAVQEKAQEFAESFSHGKTPRHGADVVCGEDELDDVEGSWLTPEQLDEIRDSAFERGFCPCCGADVREAKEHGARFCIRCGFDFSRTVPDEWDVELELSSGPGCYLPDDERLPSYGSAPAAPPTVYEAGSQALDAAVRYGAPTAMAPEPATTERQAAAAALEYGAVESQSTAAMAPIPASAVPAASEERFVPSAGQGDLASWLNQLDAPFSTTLLALIDARGMADTEVYKRANMSRQLFSKIRSDATYRPTKKTVLALAVAMGLDLGETEDLLRRAGFALSHSNKADVIVEYFIVNGNHDIFEINEALYAFDQPLL